MSKKYYSNQKKKGAVKTGILVFAILILGTGVAMAITKGFTDWNPYGWFNNQPDQQEPEENVKLDEKENESTTTPTSFTLGDNVEVVYE